MWVLRKLCSFGVSHYGVGLCIVRRAPSPMDTQPITVLHTIADHYFRDGRDFGERFDLLWEAQLHKTGRIKSFIDLLMGCECALKCHIFMGRKVEEPKAVYVQARKFSHDIGRLADYACYLNDRTSYEFMKERLGPFSVVFRYSLDAYETFFPSAMERGDAPLNYSKSIGNNAWVLEIRECLENLLGSVVNEFSGFVTDDLDVLFAHEQQMKEFTDSCIRK